ncbi:hypothetical protein BOTCAL_0253g00090 [Botryotinia calthae]|uniref:Uncharacterized protein n=1 Tax=Botryotinia calthae TaxID=38488 RepID=A0A4Y8CZ44_9HELO|nr:hypothetical protein BOTCAL_0253g00090 [Botryotinia calthae]
MNVNSKPNPAQGEPQEPHYHPQYNWLPHWALDSQSKRMATHQYNKTWNSRHSHLSRQYPDAPLYGPILMYITDKASWREIWMLLPMSGGKEMFGSPEEGVKRSVRKESDVELEVSVGAADPDVPIPSIETDGETYSPRMNICPGKEDPMKLGWMDLDPDIPIPSIEFDGDEFMDEEGSEERLAELQNGKEAVMF